MTLGEGRLSLVRTMGFPCPEKKDNSVEPRKFTKPEFSLSLFKRKKIHFCCPDFNCYKVTSRRNKEYLSLP